MVMLTRCHGSHDVVNVTRELVCAAGCTGKGHKKPCNARGAEVGLSEGGSENIEGPRAENVKRSGLVIGLGNGTRPS